LAPESSDLRSAITATLLLTIIKLLKVVALLNRAGSPCESPAPILCPPYPPTDMVGVVIISSHIMAR